MATKKSSRNRRRSDGTPTDYWAHKARPQRLGDERFQLTVLRGKATAVKDGDDVTDQCTTFSWADTSSETSGSAALTVASDQRVPINQGNKLRCDWAPKLGGSFVHLWTMKVGAPDKALAAASWSLNLSTTLTEARKSRDNYRFKKDKAHPNGWTADQIARHVGVKVHLPLGTIAKATHRITNLVMKDADPVDVIVKAYRMERNATGRRFFMHWDGTFNILPLKRPAHLLELSGVLIDAQYKAEQSEQFATSLTVRATAKAKGSKHKRKKIHVRVQSDAGVRTYGYVHRNVTAPSAHTAAEATKWGKHMLAKYMKPNRTMTVQVPIMPLVRRGDAFKVEWKSEGLTQVCFVASASHDASPGAMTTTITATFDDPYVDTQADKDAKARAAKARKRGRTGASKSAPKAPSGTKAKRRSS
jgi:hypothetical protein